MHDAHEQEKSEILHRDPEAYTKSKKYRKLFHTITSSDMGWQKRAVIANMIVLWVY